MGTWDIVEHIHETLPEWTDPKGAKTKAIHPEDIFKALGQAERIKAVKADMEELAAFQKLLSGR